MKLGLLSESPADEAALHLLVEAVLGTTVQRIHPSLRARGWPHVVQVLPAILRHLHFNTDAVGLVVVVDSDDSLEHTADHEREGSFHPRCRMCQVRAVFRQTLKKLPPARGRARLFRAIGIAVPAVEGWYLCGRDPTVTEAAWVHGQKADSRPYSRAELKYRVYGTERPTLRHETERAVQEVQRHLRDLRQLEHDFPGFGHLAHDLRAWRQPAGRH